MINLTSYLKKYSPVCLDEMDNVRFMNRIDTKFIFTVNRLEYLLENLPPDYKVLEINNSRQFRYVTTYFDTPEFLLYNQHVTGKLGRYKVRVRTYETGNLSYIEVKNKTNKGRTVKSRIKKKENVEVNSEKGLRFLREIVPIDVENLKPALTNNFSRVTLINFITLERITIDFNLSFYGNSNEFVNLPFLAIAEIKHDKSAGLTPFVQTIKDMGIRKTGFSKYCVGLALLYDIPKKNVIKPKLLILNKLKDEHSKSATA